MFQDNPSRSTLILLHLLVYLGFLLVRSTSSVPSLLEVATFGPLLIYISVIDTEHFEIPDIAVVAFAICGMVTAQFSLDSLSVRVISGLVWAGLFWGVAIAYAQWRGWDGLGFGDVKLMFGIGVWLGFDDSIRAVFYAALTAIAAIIALRVFRGGSFDDLGKTAIAFGPFLCLSAWVVWLF